MARPKRQVSIGVSSGESTPERGSPLPKRRAAAASKYKKAASPLKPKVPARRGRPPKSAAQKAVKSNGVGPDEETSALVKQLSANTNSSKNAGGVKNKTPVLDSNGTSNAVGLAAVNISEADIVAAMTPAQISELINQLVTTKQDLLFEEYKKKANESQSTDAQVIDDLTVKLEDKQKTLDTLVAHVSDLQRQVEESAANLRDISDRTSEKGAELTPLRAGCRDMYESPLRRKASGPMVHQNDVDDEFKTIAFTFDMLELLTGVRIIDYKADDDSFLFDVKQTSTVADVAHEPVSIEYQLLIQRENEGKAEITYIPSFLDALGKRGRDAEQEAKNNDARKVQQNLPEYLQQGLNFPYNTLSQFYTKLAKALNKSTKE